MSSTPIPPAPQPPTDVIGFDLGHGETAIAKATLASDTPAEMLEIAGRKNNVTAVGRHPKRGVVIGEAAVVDPGLLESHLGFKGSPLGRPGETPLVTAERNEHVRQFFKACMNALVADKKVRPGSTRVYVGCPSSWLPRQVSLGLALDAAAGSARDAYRELLRSSGIEDVEVVAESRGAFLQAMESSKLTIQELETSVLVIDIGSSTTDFTLVHDLRESPVDFGHPSLGASLIDEAILERVLAEHPRRAELEGIMREFPFVRSRLELACRRAKEAYFSDEDAFADPALPLVKSENIQRQFHVDITLDGPAMRAILDAPSPRLGGLSWRQCFKEALIAARKHLQDQGITLTALLLTGGASRMKFTRELCEEIFPEARFQPDSSPEFCIAMGLAYVGRYEVRTAGFMEEIERLCDSDHLTGIMRDNLADLVDMLTAPIAEGLADHAFRPAIQEWRDGGLKTLRELEDQVERGVVIKEGRVSQLAKAWLRSDDAKKLVGQVSIRWLDKIQDDVQREIEQVCVRYRVPAGALKFDVTPDVQEFLRGPLPGVDPANLNFIGVVVTGIVALVVASILGGGGIAILHAGPLGWLAGAALGAATAYLGVERAKEMVKTADLPVAIRGTPFAIQSIEGRCRDMIPQVRATIREQLQARPAAFETLFDTIRGKIRAELLAKAQRVRLFIGIGSAGPV